MKKKVLYNPYYEKFDTFKEVTLAVFESIQRKLTLLNTALLKKDLANNTEQTLTISDHSNIGVDKMALTVACLNEAKADTRQSTSTATGTSGEEKNRGLPNSDESALRITQLHPEEPIDRLTDKLHQASQTLKEHSSPNAYHFDRPIISSSQKTSSTQANHRPGEQDVSTRSLSAAVTFYNEKNPKQHAVARNNSIVDRESNVLLKINTDYSTTVYPPLINIASMDVQAKAMMILTAMGMTADDIEADFQRPLSIDPVDPKTELKTAILVCFEEQKRLSEQRDASFSVGLR